MPNKLKRAPVYFTLGQVQYNPILDLGPYVPVIQERMRKAGYAAFQRGAAMQFDISAVVKSGELAERTQPVARMIERFTFADAEGRNAFLLQTNSLSFETTRYETFDIFLNKLIVGLQIVHEVFGGLSFMQRLGLRYLNGVIAQEGETLSQYLANELMGLPNKMSDDMFAYNFSESLMVKQGVGQVITRIIIQNGKMGFPPDLQPEGLKVDARFEAFEGEHAVIDIDGSLEERESFDIANIALKLNAIHDEVEKSFLATVTEHARLVWSS